MLKNIFSSLGFFVLFANSFSSAQAALVLKPQPGIPVTIFNLTFHTGSSYDPQGKEGLTNLLFELLRQGGVRALSLGKETLPAQSREEIEKRLFPMAADLDVIVHREQVSFRVSANKEDSEKVFDLLSQMILAPEFNATEFERIKGEILEELKTRAPREDQEELGKAALEQEIFGRNHAYGHTILGFWSSVKNIQIEDLMNHHKKVVNKNNLFLGISGAISEKLRAHAQNRFSQLPPGEKSKPMNEVPLAKEPKLLIVEGAFPATGVHMGHTITTHKGSPEYPALLLANTALGKHRTFVGRLMKKVREIRGLNYGTYSYIEEFPNGGLLLNQDTQTSRSRQAFTVWGRPTPLENGCFLLKMIYREIQLFQEHGLEASEFDLIKSHVLGSIPLLSSSLEKTLGYALDFLFYNVPQAYFNLLAKKVERLTLKETNALIKRSILPSALSIVVTTADGKQFLNELFSSSCPIHYPEGIEKSAEITQEDQLISRLPLSLKRENSRIISAEDVYL